MKVYFEQQLKMKKVLFRNIWEMQELPAFPLDRSIFRIGKQHQSKSAVLCRLLPAPEQGENYRREIIR